MRSAKRAWVLLLLAAACPSPVLWGCSSGGADGSLDLRGATDGGTDLGRAAAPASVLSPSTTSLQVTWPREVVYTLDAPQPATIYYTLDGSEPQAGTAGTRSGKAPLTLDRPLGEGTLRWFADYGARFLPEPARTLQAHLDTGSARTDLGSLTERIAFQASGGPVVTVDAGAELRAQAPVHKADYRQFMGLYPDLTSADVQHYIVVGYDEVGKCLGDPATFSNRNYERNIGRL